MSIMDSQRLLDLMTRKIGKIASDEEIRELDALMSGSPEYAYLYEVIISLTCKPYHLEKNIPQDELIANGWHHLKDKMGGGLNSIPGKNLNERKNKPLRIFRLSMQRIAAAGIILISFCAGLFFYKSFRRQVVDNKIVATVPKVLNTPNGKITKLTLSDGTKVWLNMGSHLEYPEVFGKTSREVTIEGEAFFDVAKDAHAPFLVHAGHLTVHVLGTSFNVKAYPEDKDIETTLISGRVKVRLNDEPDKEITLFPYEKLTVVKRVLEKEMTAQTRSVSNELRYKVQALPASTDSVFAETAWINNKLIISNQSFDHVAKLLERKYDVQFYFKGKNWSEERLSGVFEKEDIRQVLEILKMTTQFSFKIEGNSVYIF